MILHDLKRPDLVRWTVDDLGTLSGERSDDEPRPQLFGFLEQLLHAHFGVELHEPVELPLQDHPDVDPS